MLLVRKAAHLGGFQSFHVDLAHRQAVEGITELPMHAVALAVVPVAVALNHTQNSSSF